MFPPGVSFTTASLGANAWGEVVVHILQQALQAVEPSVGVRHMVQRHDMLLTLDGHDYDLRAYERVFLVGAGKASAAMAHTLTEILGAHLTDGIVIVKENEQTPIPDMTCPELVPARHPIPDERGRAATQRIASLLQQTTERDLVLVLISGGGSALLTLPATGICLNDMQHLTSLLLACGATINEINCIRKHLDMVKGGGLARMAAPASVATLILSDVVGNPLDVIASGPTCPDPSTFAEAYHVLERYSLLERTPRTIVAHIQAGIRGEIAETPKTGDPIFSRVQHVLTGSNLHAATAALHAAHAKGLHTLLLTTAMQGEARVVGQFLAGVVREMATRGSSSDSSVPLHLPRPACIVASGETTVTLRGNGKGGRNQELALAAVRGLAGLPHSALVTLATDGEDGPTDAAGAVVTGATLERAQRLGYNPDVALAHNDSHSFFVALDDVIKTGATGTNVNDLVLLFAW